MMLKTMLSATNIIQEIASNATETNVSSQLQTTTFTCRHGTNDKRNEDVFVGVHLTPEQRHVMLSTAQTFIQVETPLLSASNIAIVVNQFDVAWNPVHVAVNVLLFKVLDVNGWFASLLQHELV